VKANPLLESGIEHGESARNVTLARSLHSPVATTNGVILSTTSKRSTPNLPSKMSAVIENCARRLFSRQQELKRLTAQGPVAGSIWTTCPEKEEDLFGPLVFVLETPAPEREAAWVAEVTQDCELAESGDIILPRKTSGLHFSCIIRVSIVFSLEPQKLLGCAGKLSEQQTRQIVKQVSHSA
jgi:hypothetical protein